MRYLSFIFSLHRAHHVFIKGGDTGVLTTGSPYIGDAEGKEPQQMQGKKPDIQSEQTDPVSMHHGPGCPYDSVRAHFREIEKEEVGHGKGE